MSQQDKIEICLARAAMLLYRDGYHRLNTMQAIDVITHLQRLGKNHVTDKLHLTLEVMEFIHRLEKQHLFYHMESMGSTEDKLYQLLRNIQDYLTEYDYFTLIIRLSQLPKGAESEIHTYCHYYFSTWTDAFSQLFLPSHGEQAKQLANTVLCLFIGAVFMARVQEDNTVLEHVVTWTMRVFTSSKPTNRM